MQEEQVKVDGIHVGLQVHTCICHLIETIKHDFSTLETTGT